MVYANADAQGCKDTIDALVIEAIAEAGMSTKGMLHMSSGFEVLIVASLW